MKYSIPKANFIQSSKRFIVAFVALLIVLSISMHFTNMVSADQYDDKIAALQQDIDNYNAQAAKLAAEATTLQSAIAVLQNQVSVIQAQINVSQIKYDQLIAQIADTEQKIKDNKEALGIIIANLYVDDNVSPIEMLASSNSISDFMDKQEYRNSVRDQLSETIVQIKELKVQLEKQKEDVNTVLVKQKSERSILAATQEQQQVLLDETKGQEAAYQQLVARNKQQLADVAAQQRAYYDSLVNGGGGVNSGVVGDFQYSNWSGNQGCTGGYPWSAIGSWGSQWGCQNGLDVGIDNWQLYNRECVSYVAWALEARFGKFVGGFSGHGMAYEWPTSALIYSGATRVYNPQPGDAVVLPPSGNFAPVGHLMIVESVSGDTIHVSQYNFYGTGEYSTMDIKNSGIVLLRFQNNV